MKGKVVTGELTYVNTEDGNIRLTWQDEGEEYERNLNIDSDTEIVGPYTWEYLLGEDVKVTVIDDKVKSVYLPDKE